MFDGLFGAEGSLIVRFIVAFVIVLALIGLTFWLVRRFGGARVGTAAQRGRQPRLAVIDAAPIDGRRRLVLVRRDNVEHLLIIGGPSDVVVEQNIVRAVPVNPPRDVPVPRQPGAEGRPEPARVPALDEDWPEPAPRTYARPEAPARVARQVEARQVEARQAEPRQAEPRQVEARAAAIEARQAEPRIPEPRMPEPRMPEPRVGEPRVPEPRAFEPAVRTPLPPSIREPAPPPIVPAAEPAEPSPDDALANMAQRLEAALRRPGSPEPRPQPALARIEPELPEPPPTAPDFAPPAEPKPAKPKSVLDSLEEEMASLLGRPPEKQ